MADELFDVNFNSLDTSGESIDLSELTQEPADTPVVEETEVVEDKQKETPKQKAEEDDLIDISAEDKEDNKSTTGEEETNTPETPKAEEESSPITPFASLLQEKGFLPHSNIEDIAKAEDPIEALIEAVRNEQQQWQQDFINNTFPEELIDMAEAVARGVPFDSIKQAKQTELKYSTLDTEKVKEDVNLQKQIVTEFLTKKGFKADKVSKYVEKYEDMGDLETEAIDAIAELKEIAKVEQAAARERFQVQQKQMEENNKQVISNIEKQIAETKEIFPGRPLTEDMRKKTLNSMLQIVDQDTQGNPLNGIMAERAKDPVKFDMTVAYMMNLTNGFTDWSKIGATAKSSAAKDLAKALSTNTSHISGSPKKIEADEDVLKGLNFI